KIPSVMLNILGEPGFQGTAVYQGLEECMEVDGAKFHIYGKTETKPYRKMGHVTVIDNDISSAKDKAEFIKDNLKVIS
nr:5-(carboxyamino)imidazole ribonucleotide synthase [Candidatus Dadabacteria bacterium]NIQ16481.1 5-(carboxyamino)imidazole ribonucleotide synthase [Candidatus Dadabacteria bacterium]